MAENLREWEPIESAPKGQMIWLGSPTSIRIGFWVHGAENENHGSVGGGWRDLALSECRGQCGLRYAPTHWMALPDPPLPCAPLPESE